MERVKKKYVGVVNGERVYKWAYDINEFKRLCRMEALSKFGKFKITDHKIIQSKVRYE